MLTKRTGESKRKSWLKLFFVFSSFLMISACQTVPSTFLIADNLSGFGGTGKQQENVSGFGGTGKSSPGFGGTGIVGTITGFGSIWVNGIEIGYGSQTRVTSDLSGIDKLKKGKQVVLETLPLKNKTITKSIRIFYPIAGEITSKTSNTVVINYKYKVTLRPDTLKDKGLNEKVGDFVAMNGYQVAQNNWVATRLNQNLAKQTFYHEMPTLHFSARVDRVIIEAGLMQLDNMKWHNEIKSQLKGMQRLIIEVKGRDAANFRPEKIESYRGFIRNRQREQLDEIKRVNEESKQVMEMKRVNETSRQMMEMKELKSQQNSLIEKQHQQQEMLNQQKQMMEMHRMRSRQLKQLELRPD